MRWIRCLVIATTCAAGCKTVRVGRPPSAGEIAAIDEAVARGRGLVIEPPLVLARRPSADGCEGSACERVVPLESCAAGACDHVAHGVREIPYLIVSADDQLITFQTKGGAIGLPRHYVFSNQPEPPGTHGSGTPTVAPDPPPASAE